jgi:hypothetical protein
MVAALESTSGIGVLAMAWSLKRWISTPTVMRSTSAVVDTLPGPMHSHSLKVSVNRCESSGRLAQRQSK